MILATNMPINTIIHPSFRSFQNQFTNRETPLSTTIHNYIEEIFNNTIEKIRKQLANSPICLIVDETTDACNRYVVNVFVTNLNGNFNKPMLIMTKFILKTNNSTVQQCIMNVLNRI